MEKNIEKKCVVCGNIVMTDIYGQGDCKNCGWYNDLMGEENENEVIFPNLVSLAKAKKLYKEGKEIRPDLSDFLDGFMFYGEMEFIYNNLCCDLFGHGEEGIAFGWSPENVYYFSGKEDFIKNAKIGDEYVRDIWDKVEDPRYL